MPDITWRPLTEMHSSQPAVWTDTGVFELSVFTLDGVPTWEVHGGPKKGKSGRLEPVTSGTADSLEAAKAAALTAAEAALASNHPLVAKAALQPAVDRQAAAIDAAQRRLHQLLDALEGARKDGLERMDSADLRLVADIFEDVSDEHFRTVHEAQDEQRYGASGRLRDFLVIHQDRDIMDRASPPRIVCIVSARAPGEAHELAYAARLFDTGSSWAHPADDMERILRDGFSMDDVNAASRLPSKHDGLNN